MARSQLYGVGGARQVDGLIASLLCLAFLTELVDALCGECLQFVDLHADSLLLVGSHVTEVVHQLSDGSFLTEIFQSELFHFLGVLRTQFLHLFEQFVYLIKYHLIYNLTIYNLTIKEICVQRYKKRHRLNRYSRIFL